jgi:hypothetical protein
MGKLTAIARDKYPKTLALPTATDPESFSLPLARALSWAAQLSYESDNPTKYQSILKDWRWQSVIAIVKPLSTKLPMLKGTKMFIARSGDATIVSFAGTEPDNPGNWVSDFKFLRTTKDVHGGFSDGVDAVWSDISAAIEAATAIYFCGHSLGAAMAGLAAYRFVTEQPGGTARTAAQRSDCLRRLKGVYVFGMPRVAGVAFAPQYNALLGRRAFRLVHGSDIVPKVPPASFGFEHVGRLLACTSLGTFDAAKLSQEVGEKKTSFWLRIKDVMKTVFTFGGPKGPPFPGEDPDVIAAIDALPRFVRDHLPDRYLQAAGALGK